MAKVLLFPTKKKLPKCIEDRIHEAAQSYVETLVIASEMLCDEPTDEEMNEVTELVLQEYAKALIEAIDEMV